MTYNLAPHIEKEIIALGKTYDLNKIILFGSRAKRTNHERSDIDIAVSGGNTRDFAFAIEESLFTLLWIDVVDLDDIVSDRLREEIKRDGVVLYDRV